MKIIGIGLCLIGLGWIGYDVYLITSLKKRIPPASKGHMPWEDPEPWEFPED